MNRIALVGDPLIGIHPSLPPATITGSINSGSPNVYIRGVRVARVGDTTIEYCGLHDEPQTGHLINGSPKVFANSMAIACAMADIQPHAGTAELTGGGSTHVFI